MKRYIKSNTDKIAGKFQVGQNYTASMLYGGSVFYKVVRRTSDTVTFRESHISEDTGNEVDDGVKTLPITLVEAYQYERTDHFDDPDWGKVIGLKEAVPIWEYRGEVGYLFAYID